MDKLNFKDPQTIGVGVLIFLSLLALFNSVKNSDNSDNSDNKDDNSCPNGFAGNPCKLICENRCNFGNCTVDGCICEPGYTGEFCNELICKDKCNNGSCTPDGCICNPGYKGNDCTELICKDNCINGECTTAGCTCEPGYIGEFCDTFVSGNDITNGDIRNIAISGNTIVIFKQGNLEVYRINNTTKNWDLLYQTSWGDIKYLSMYNENIFSILTTENGVYKFEIESNGSVIIRSTQLLSNYSANQNVSIRDVNIDYFVMTFPDIIYINDIYLSSDNISSNAPSNQDVGIFITNDNEYFDATKQTIQTVFTNVSTQIQRQNHLYNYSVNDLRDGGTLINDYHITRYNVKQPESGASLLIDDNTSLMGFINLSSIVCYATENNIILQNLPSLLPKEMRFFQETLMTYNISLKFYNSFCILPDTSIVTYDTDSNLLRWYEGELIQTLETNVEINKIESYDYQILVNFNTDSESFVKLYNLDIYNEIKTAYFDGTTVMDINGKKIKGDQYKNHIHNLIVLDNVKIIPERAFAYMTKLCYVTLPSSLEEIGRSAFTSCFNLNTIVVPEGVLRLGNNAFRSCGMRTIILPNTLQEIGYDCFQSCFRLTSITIPKNVVFADMNSLFRNCGQLMTCNFQNFPETISNNCFEDCHSLKNITLPESVKSIGRHAFRRCYTLEKIRFPNSCELLSDSSFVACFSLETLENSTAIKFLTSNTFADCVSLNFNNAFRDNYPTYLEFVIKGSTITNNNKISNTNPDKRLKSVNYSNKITEVKNSSYIKKIIFVRPNDVSTNDTNSSKIYDIMIYTDKKILSIVFYTSKNSKLDISNVTPNTVYTKDNKNYNVFTIPSDLKSEIGLMLVGSNLLQKTTIINPASLYNSNKKLKSSKTYAYSYNMKNGKFSKTKYLPNDTTPENVVQEEEDKSFNTNLVYLAIVALLALSALVLFSNNRNSIIKK